MQKYALSVCCTLVFALVILGGFLGYSIFEISTPELTLDTYEYEKYQSNDAYWDSKESCSDEDEHKVEKRAKPSDEELTKQRLDAYSLAVKNERRNGIQGLIQYSIFIFFSSIALFIHWKIANKVRES